jgi:hypothetical protein
MIHIADFNFANLMRVRPAPVDGWYCVSRLYPHRQRSYCKSQIRKPSLSLPTTYSGRAAELISVRTGPVIQTGSLRKRPAAGDSKSLLVPSWRAIGLQ